MIDDGVVEVGGDNLPIDIVVAASISLRSSGGCCAFVLKAPTTRQTATSARVVQLFDGCIVLFCVR